MGSSFLRKDYHRRQQPAGSQFVQRFARAEQTDLVFRAGFRGGGDVEGGGLAVAAEGVGSFAFVVRERNVLAVDEHYHSAVGRADPEENLLVGGYGGMNVFVRYHSEPIDMLLRFLTGLFVVGDAHWGFGDDAVDHSIRRHAVTGRVPVGDEAVSQDGVGVVTVCPRLRFEFVSGTAFSP